MIPYFCAGGRSNSANEIANQSYASPPPEFRRLNLIYPLRRQPFKPSRTPPPLELERQADTDGEDAVQVDVAGARVLSVVSVNRPVSRTFIAIPGRTSNSTPAEQPADGCRIGVAAEDTRRSAARRTGGSRA